MSSTTGDAGAPPTGSSGSNTTPMGDGGADGGAAPTSGGTVNTAGKGSGGKAGATSSGGKAGTGGKGPSGPCGNKTIDDGEECDDGNEKSGDGCSAQCQNKCEGCEAVAAQTPFGSAVLDGDYYFDCYKATDYSTGGPADGAPRAELCADVVDCVRRTGCGVFSGKRVAETTTNDASINPCWCKDVQDSPDTIKQPAVTCFDEATVNPGPCYAEFLNAAEADSPSGIANAIIDVGSALGRAGSLFRQIDSLICPAECWPEPAGTGGGGSGGTGGGGAAGMGGGGSGGKAGAGGGGTGGGGAGGTGGSGGSGGGGSGKCGNGTVDAGEQCEPPSSTTCSDDCKRVLDNACVDSPCEADSDCAGTSENCLLFDGAAQTLCFDVMECVRSSSCGDGPVDGNHGLKKCFCAELSTANCIAAPNSGAGSPAGACAPIIRQAFTMGGTPATNGEILTNYLDNTIPGGAAMERLNCDWNFLTPECRTKCGF